MSKKEKKVKKTRKVSKKTPVVFITSKQNISVKGLYLPSGVSMKITESKYKSLMKSNFNLRLLSSVGVIKVGKSSTSK